MCRLELGNETYKTSTKDNAGGTCTFKEKFAFNKQKSENLLKVWSSLTVLRWRAVFNALFPLASLRCGVHFGGIDEVRSI